MRITCADLAALVTDYLEGAMPGRRARSFERHLARCVDCDMYLRQMRLTIEATGQLGAADLEAVPASVRAQLAEAFHAASNDDA